MTLILKDRKSYIQKSEFEQERFDRFFNEIVQDSDRQFDQQDLEDIKQSVLEEVLSRDEVFADRLFDLIIREANEKISAETPQYTYLSAATLRRC